MGRAHPAANAALGQFRMTDKKPDIGTEAEMIARLRAVTEEIRKLRRDFQASVRGHRARRERPTASDKSKAHKKR